MTRLIQETKKTLKTEKQEREHRLTIRLPIELLPVIQEIERNELVMGANQSVIEALKYYRKMHMRNK